MGWPLPSAWSGRQSAAGRRLDPACLADHIDQLYRTARAMCGSREEAEDLVQEIEALPVSFRDALVAVDIMELSYDEAARAVRVKQATLTTRLHRARQRRGRLTPGEPQMHSGSGPSK